MIFFPLMVVFLVGDAIATYYAPAYWLAWLAVGSAAGLAWIAFEAWRISR